jgi:hypothetical protein
MSLLEAWDTKIKTGKSVPLEEFLAQRETARKATPLRSFLTLSFRKLYANLPNGVQNIVDEKFRLFQQDPFIGQPACRLLSFHFDRWSR